MWVWFLAALAGIIAVAILCLCIPVVATVNVSTRERRKAAARVGWLFGLYRKQIVPPPRRSWRRRRAGGARLGRVWTLLLARDFRQSLMRLGKQSAHRLKVRELDVRARLGLANPAVTAVLFGALWAARPLLRLPPRYRIDVQPSMVGSAFEGELHCVLEVQPVRLVIPFGRFVFSRQGLRVMRLLLSAPKKKARRNSSPPGSR